jgi:NAD-dependent dihydropyrimidine dehydrogenase PreA subunit
MMTKINKRGVKRMENENEDLDVRTCDICLRTFPTKVFTVTETTKRALGTDEVTVVDHYTLCHECLYELYLGTKEAAIRAFETRRTIDS